ncbi:hypothetical protein BZK31_19115 [Pseudomonas floridensis]|uniref:Uncharacterized protein n=1 Tax=Pseudomonas floridensis TaxID=1958950 RepID=A0A1X0N2B6_9PSED|nr:hypothetical protein [Pseudomonas floridensis]ORC57645.1 hypothetical protein BZK31_19115 [Pseudomonas floridensis]
MASNSREGSFLARLEYVFDPGAEENNKLVQLEKSRMLARLTVPQYSSSNVTISPSEEANREYIANFGFAKLDANGLIEVHDFLCVNSVVSKPLNVYFRPNDEGAYIMECQEQATESQSISLHVDPASGSTYQVFGDPVISSPDSEKVMYIGIDDGWIVRTRRAGIAFLALIERCDKNLFFY